MTDKKSCNIAPNYICYRNDAMFGLEGWLADPLFDKLKIPIKTIEEIFPPLSNILSHTLMDNKTPVGQCNTETFDTFLKNHLLTLNKLIDNNSSGIQRLREIMLVVFAVEMFLLNQLKTKFKDNSIIHVNSFIVMKAYSDQGYETKLLRENHKSLCIQGKKVVIMETTNKKSASIALKNEFKIYHEFSYKTLFNIDLDDKIIIWIKYL